MRYVSTRGQAPELGFADVLLAGLAPDGGLYVPVEWPRLPKDLPTGSYQALAAGAVEVLAKPDAGRGIARIAWELANGVKAAARSKPRGKATPAQPSSVAGLQLESSAAARGRMLFIGASTGGVEALRELLPQLDAERFWQVHRSTIINLDHRLI